MPFSGSQALGGAAKGAAVGAAVGSFIPIPGVGTAVGAGVGALTGGLISGFSGGKQKKAEQEALDFQKSLAAEQAAEAQRIQAELDAQGRPIMEAQVQRQQEIAALAQRAAQEGMPTAQYENAQQNIEQGAAQALGGATSLGGGLRALGGVQSSTAGQYRQLNAQDVAMAQQNQGTYMNALSALGAAESQAEQYNTLMPYEQKVAEMQALQGAALQNQFGALNFNTQLASQRNQQTQQGLNSAMSVAPAIARETKDSFNGFTY
jgi:hypothetical protein